MKRKPTIYAYRNQIGFTLLFTLIAVLFMTIGFWETLLLLIFTASGYFIGRVQDKQLSISSIIASLQALIGR